MASEVGLVKFALIRPGAKLPTRSNFGDAGLDVYSPKPAIVPAGRTLLIATGLKCEFPPGFVMHVWDRSSMAISRNCIVMAGTIDCGYRGEIHIKLANLSPSEDVLIHAGDRVAQLVMTKIWFGPPVQVDEIDLSDSPRGTDGLGSTGA